MATADIDNSWADLARSSRAALALLGYDITEKCLPDEEKPCGGTFAIHVAAHFGCINAIIEHQLKCHLGPVYESVIDDVRQNFPGTLHCNAGELPSCERLT